MQNKGAFLLVVVLALIVLGIAFLFIAPIAGIYAFSSIKAHRASAAAPVVSPAKTGQTIADFETYIVAKGDKPATVAKKLHVSADSLMKLNKISDPTKLQVGQKLRVPPKHLASGS